MLSSLSGSMLSLGLPEMAEGLGVDMAAISFVMTSFFLTCIVFLLPAGKLGDRVGARRAWFWGLGILATSALAGFFSVALWQVIAARVLQGLGAALLMSSGPAVLTSVVPKERRGRALGLVSTATYIGLAGGPPLGGLLLEFFSWNALFGVMVPVVLVLLLVARGLPQSAGAEVATGPRPGLDWAGFFLWGGAMLLLVLGMGLGRPGHWALQGLAMGLGLALLGGLVLLEWLRPGGLLDLELFRNRTFAGAVLAAVMNYWAMFIFVLLVPFLLRNGLGLNHSVMGIVLTVQPLLMAVTAPLSGARSDRAGTTRPAVLGQLLSAAAFLALAVGPVSQSLTALCVAMAVLGIGTGIFIAPNSSALMGAVPQARRSEAGAYLALARNLGQVLGGGSAAMLFTLAGGAGGTAIWTEADHGALWLPFGFAALACLVAAASSQWRGSSKRLSN
jgi:MFS family permease